MPYDEDRNDRLRRRFADRLEPEYGEQAAPERNASQRREADAQDDPRDEGLMSRRLRHRRGEPDEDEYDEPPPRTYPRMYAAPPMPPRYGGGMGCLGNMAAAIAGAVAVVLLALLFGRQLLGGLLPSIPVLPNVAETVRTVLITPTPTVRDRGGTIKQIRSLNRLETQTVSAERVVEARSERGNLLDTFLGERLLLIASGNVVAGVDLSKLTEDDVQLSSDGKSITLTLPPSEIFSSSLENQRTRVYDRTSGVLTRLVEGENPNLETQARQAADDEILQAACEVGIMQKAADDAQRSMEQFLQLLDFEQVTVNVSAGACVVPSGSATATP